MTKVTIEDFYKIYKTTTVHFNEKKNNSFEIVNLYYLSVKKSRVKYS